MNVHLIQPSHVSLGIGVITPRWLARARGATPRRFGDPVIIASPIPVAACHRVPMPDLMVPV